ncbi:MAG: TRAP transporter large permease, partial [Firmicutes bacterium]|nr:TRAP transporter large permease [Bacillota bacterium]
MELLIGALVLAIILILLGMDIGVSFLVSVTGYMLLTGGSMTSFPRLAFNANLSYSLLAVPLFILGGVLMEKSGIATAIVEWCESLLKKTKSGMGAVIPVACMFFGTLCGSALATVSTVGNMLIGKLEERGWDRRYTSALVAASSPLGYMIPPNMNAIIFSVVSTASVSALFLASIVPGILWGLGYVVLNMFMYKKYYDPEGIGKAAQIRNSKDGVYVPHEIKPLGKASYQAIPAALMPVIILGGIYGGICTPTEAGAVSALYALFAGVVMYKKLSMKEVIGSFYETGSQLGTMMIIFPFATLFTTVAVMNGLPNLVAQFIGSLAVPHWILLIVIDLIFIVAGCFFDAPILTLVIPPLLTPTMNMLGISGEQFGVIVFMAIGIGSCTPPMA